MSKDWEILRSEQLHQGWFRISRYHFRHTLYQGGWSGEVDRDIFERGNVAAVIPYDPVNDTVLLVEQFRIGAMHRPEGPWLTEIIAGMIEEGEVAEEVVRRESQEEAGLTLTDLIPVRKYYASPGGTTEEVNIFCGLTDLGGAGGIYGLADESEDIRAQCFPAEQAIEMLDNGTLCNAITIIAMQWFKMNLDWLRQQTL